MAKLNKQAPPPLIKESITPAEVEAIIRQELKDRAKAYLDAPDNYLSNEVDFLDQDIEQWQRGLKNAEEAHLRLFHSFENPSIFRQERDVFRLRIKVAKERRAELLAPWETAKVLPASPKITYAQVALIFRYDNKPLDFIKATKLLADKFPHLTGPKELMDKFNLFKDAKGRVSGFTQKKQITDRIKDINASMPYLKTATGKAQAKAETRTLEKMKEDF